MRADRLLRIVTLLRRHGRLSASELAARLEVTPRTVLRDMEALSSAGVPVYAERGRRGGFALLPGYEPATQQLSAEEIEALLLSGSGAAPRLGLGGPLASALAKLSSTLAPELVDAAARAGDRIVVDPAGWAFGGDDDERSMPCLAEVQRAALGDLRVRLGYRHGNAAEAATRTVDPYGLLLAGSRWYLVAAHRGRPHTYRVDRIDSARVLDEPSGRPPDLDLRALWRQLRAAFTVPPTLTVRVEVADARPSEPSIMLAAVGSGPPRIEPGPPMVLEVETLGVHAAATALAGFGDRVRVLHPPEVVEELRHRLAAAARVYDAAASARSRPKQRHSGWSA